VYSVFVEIISSDLVLVLNNWYQRTFLGQRREDLFYLFAEFFFSREEKEGGALQVHI
jgi:hypothetical protein